MGDTINRLKCDCGDCQSWSSHTITIDFEGHIAERHVCAPHFEFLASVHPHMLKDQPSPEIWISGADLGAFLEGARRRRKKKG
jgi:hypothetical protein